MKKITNIEGIVQFRKDGTVILSDSDYYVTNAEEFNMAELGDKTIEVEGYIFESKNNSLLPPFDDGILRQGIVTNSWEEYKLLNKQNCITIHKIISIKK